VANSQRSYARFCSGVFARVAQAPRAYRSVDELIIMPGAPKLDTTLDNFRRQSVDMQLLAVIFYLNAAALMPFAEEILFRGFLLTPLSRKFGSPAATIFSAALFSVVHGCPSPKPCPGSRDGPPTCLGLETLDTGTRPGASRSIAARRRPRAVWRQDSRGHRGRSGRTMEAAAVSRWREDSS
jgi:hypothetical protein